MLREHGADIAVLVCDQRMPGEQGNALLRHTRDNYPAIVRMLTTAYSELGDAIEAINSGEIYRYINKPWELESLRADLRNALELAELRSERDPLMRDKLLARQGQRLAGGGHGAARRRTGLIFWRAPGAFISAPGSTRSGAVQSSRNTWPSRGSLWPCSSSP